MRRRRKFKATAIIEAVGGILGLGVLFWFISPAFRLWLQVIVVVAAGLLAVLLVIWLIHMTSRPIACSSSFKTIDPPHPPGGKQLNSGPTPTIGEESRYAPPAPAPTMSEQLRKIDWYQFEKLMELVYRHRGFIVRRMGGANPDGGVDLLIESPAEKCVVQCKHWRNWKVGVRHIREFLGTLTDSGVPKGVFITLSGYTGEARQLADKHRIQILGESDVVQMLEETGLKQAKEISQLLRDERKRCPKCEREMVLRTARVKGNPFWGCSGFPRCKFILNFEG